MSLPLVVEVHSHDPQYGRGGMLEIQDLLSSVAWSDSVNPPWGGITLVSRRNLTGLRRDLPTPSDWIVIRLERGGPAVAWGRVSPKRTGIRAMEGGARVADPVTIEAESWLAFLGRVQLFVALGIFGTVGTLFSTEDWESLYRFVGSSLSSMGRALEEFMRSVPRVLLPPTLGGRVGVPDSTIRGLMAGGYNIPGVGRLVINADPLATMRGTLCHAIDVIHDGPSAFRLAGAARAERRMHGIPTLASTRAAEAVPGPTLSALQNVSGIPETTVLDLMMGTFGADPALVELFPSLEDPGFPGSPFGAFDMVPTAVGIPAAGRVQPPETALPTGELANPTGSALGRNPVLVFRMRPWRAMPLLEFAQRRLGGGREMWVNPTIFQETTWNIAEAQPVSDDDVTALTLGVSDDDNINAATVGLPTDPSSALRFNERAGLPIVAPAQIIRDGLRLYQVHWPFFKPTGALSELEQFTDLQYRFCIAATAYQFMFNAGRFFGGVVTSRWRPDLRHGRMIHVTLPADLADGTSAPGFYAYAETVAHRIDAHPGGRVTRRTDVTYSRGLFEDEEIRRRTLSGLNDGSFAAERPDRRERAGIEP